MNKFMRISLFLCIFQSGICKSSIHKLVTNINDITDVLSFECQLALKIFVDRLNQTDIKDDEMWALQMLDASSKVPVGLLSYNFGEMGDFKQCIEIVSTKDNIGGKYCLGQVIVNSSGIDNQSVYVQNHRYIKSLLSKVSGGIHMIGNPTWALCLPSNCSDLDAIAIMNSSRGLGISISSVSCQTIEDVYPPLDRDALIGISILCLLISLVIVSTAFDLYFLYVGEGRDRSICAFSVFSNGKKLFSISKRASNLSCLDGIRVISMFWIIILHTHSVYTSGPVFNSKDVVEFANSLVSMVFINGDLACDTFLMVGGTLVTYVFFKTNAMPILNLRVILRHYLHRYVRLTPALAGMVLVSATLLKYFGSGPRWFYIVTSFEGFCKKNWWTTLLYIQNEYNVSQMCVGHSWYLDVDMQLYFFSPLIFFMLMKYPKSGISMVSLATIGSIIYSFVRAYLDEMSGISSTYYSPTPTSVYMNNYYLKTTTRAAPWLMGNILGYILTRRWCEKVKLSKMYSMCFWTMSIGVILLCTFLGHSTLRGPDYRRFENALYIALLRPTFALSVGWVIWACATNHGGIINRFLSLPIFQFLNKFIYSMYLLHVTALYMIVFSSKTSIYFNVFNLTYWFWGIFMYMFGLSIIWALIFESPMIALEKIVFRNIKDN
ncbi:nose resistant to fluoxetine protein 6-like isoform X1 [Diorhabda sublineata]|uniref:nose resistant to fluoxetine protein 6-like isoform X1 n=1 Tax=Diorhabda sublineata TaxID=1163346 RepID=UPI0024E137F8|nr:nose resistant to fluoxetine protein 6-like isoform X1 [Diorhabda sublineata]XP_056638243.1 nose resistant to fluoxetine protein 6-like isoform X1 [Diorhabda sublineata]